MADESIYDQMKNAGLSRRSFLKFCGLLLSNGRQHVTTD